MVAKWNSEDQALYLIYNGKWETQWNIDKGLLHGTFGSIWGQILVNNSEKVGLLIRNTFNILKSCQLINVFLNFYRNCFGCCMTWAI